MEVVKRARLSGPWRGIYSDCLYEMRHYIRRPEELSIVGLLQKSTRKKTCWHLKHVYCFAYFEKLGASITRLLA
jgi:hypothetical protein